MIPYASIINLIKRSRLSFILPSLLGIGLFILAIFFYLIPSFEGQLIAYKQETARELVQSVWSLLESYHAQEVAGELTRQEAQQRAIARIRPLRYGDGMMDYFWINDATPRMIMHPYRTDLEGTDLQSFTDPDGKHLFVDAVMMARAKKEGFITYKWQRHDNPREIMTKLSYIKWFEPWGWILGSGIYMNDVYAETEKILWTLSLVSLGILAFMLSIHLYILVRGIRSERIRFAAEAALARSEGKYRDLVKNANSIILRLDKTGRITFFNEFALRLFGYDLHEVLGKSVVGTIVPQTESTGRDLDALIRDLIKHPERYASNENENICRSGRRLWISWTNKALVGEQGVVSEILCIGNDITERKLAEAALKESEKKFRTLAENINIGVFRTTVDEEGRILYANQALAKIYGADSPEEMLTLRIVDVYGSPADRAVLLKDLFAAGQVRAREILLKNKKGEPIWCSINAQMQYGDDGTPGCLDGTIENISERKQAEKDLLESRERLDLALQGASLGMWDWHIDTGKIILNERWANIVGFRLGEISPHITTWEKMIHPDDAPGVLSAIRDHLEDKTTSYQSEHRLLTKSGDWVWVLDCGRVVERDVNGRPLRATGIVLDITIRRAAAEKLRLAYDELREREEELRQANKELRDINLRLKESEQSLTMAIDISRASIWEYDVKTHQTHFKRYPSESPLGYSMEELAKKGEAFSELYNPDSWRKAQDALAAYLRGETDTYETEICMRSKSGDWVWSYVLGKASEYASGGAPQKLLGIAIDITPIKKAQEEVKAAREQLIQADKLVALGTLVAGVAHEINNPNNFVMLNTPLIQEIWRGLLPVLEQYYREQGDFKAGGMQYSKVREAVPTLLNGILDGARRISTIVKELKDFARPDDVSMNQKVDINAAVRAAVSLLHNVIKKATSSFTVTYGENLPPVPGNTQRLEQVFINLILNACQALPDTTRAIQVTTASDRDSIAVTVRDEGRGIPREYLSQIMDPFFTTKRGAGGTGLGLSISRKIIDEHNGRMYVDSREGQGATFTVLLPVRSVEKGHRILIADDEESMRSIMYTVLSKNPSYEVRTVENGTGACILLGKWQPDLIVLDINMPDMNGVEVCRRIKSDPDFANTKVIICTGHPDSREMQDILKMGFSDVLPKPFHNEELKRVVAEALTKKDNVF